MYLCGCTCTDCTQSFGNILQGSGGMQTYLWSIPLGWLLWYCWLHCSRVVQCQNLTRQSCECFIAETTLELLGIRERSLHNTLYVNNLR